MGGAEPEIEEENTKKNWGKNDKGDLVIACGNEEGKLKRKKKRVEGLEIYHTRRDMVN